MAVQSERGCQVSIELSINAKTRTVQLSKGFLISVAVIPLIALSSTEGYAVSQSVKQACKNDYFAHCSAHAVGSSALRSCMRKVGKRLSSSCVKALVKSGEVTKADLSKYK